MTIIEQLEQSVSLPILGSEQSIAHISLLEQFYALLIARLASPKVYTQLLQSTHQPVAQQLADYPVVEITELVTSDNSLPNDLADHSMFMQLWQDQSQRQLIVDELVATHHIDKSATIRLITSATTLAYHELKVLAKGQFLPAFLQQQQSQIRHYLPVWAESVLTADISHEVANNSDGQVDTIEAINPATINANNINKDSIEETSNERATPVFSASLTSAVADIELVATEALIVKDTGHINSNYTSADNAIAVNESILAPPIPIDDSGHSLSQINNTRQRNKRNDFLLRLFLLVAAIAALALLWLFVIQPNYIDAAEPVKVTPVITVTEPEPIAPILTPIELLVAVDNSGSLYTCSATVGDTALQEGLKQALVMSFGDQANICKLNIKAGVANNLANINIGLLPSFFTLLRSAPFARLQLQNDIITIESPDDVLSQRLLTDMRALAPTATITTSAPLAATENYTMTEEAPMPNNNFDQQNSAESNNNFYYPPNDNDSFDNSGNSNNDNSANNSANNGTDANLNNTAVANKIPIGGMSTAEADALANSVIVAEQLRNESRVEPNVGAK